MAVSLAYTGENAKDNESPTTRTPSAGGAAGGGRGGVGVWVGETGTRQKDGIMRKCVA